MRPGQWSRGERSVESAISGSLTPTGALYLLCLVRQLDEKLSGREEISQEGSVKGGGGAPAQPFGERPGPDCRSARKSASWESRWTTTRARSTELSNASVRSGGRQLTREGRCSFRMPLSANLQEATSIPLDRSLLYCCLPNSFSNHGIKSFLSNSTPFPLPCSLPTCGLTRTWPLASSSGETVKA
jgi:hypothetical protein